MAGEARQDPATKAGAIKRVADQSGMHLKMTAASLVVRLRMRALPTPPGKLPGEASGQGVVWLRRLL